MLAGGALGLLLRLVVHGQGVCVWGEDKGMAADHLVGDATGYVGKREGAGFLGDAGVIDDLQQQVAKLVGQRRHILPGDGVGDFVGFLDCVGRDGREGLHPVPRAAIIGVT